MSQQDTNNNINIKINPNPIFVSGIVAPNLVYPYNSILKNILGDKMSDPHVIKDKDGKIIAYINY